jgi:hypothetical protein
MACLGWRYYAVHAAWMGTDISITMIGAAEFRC